ITFAEKTKSDFDQFYKLLNEITKDHNVVKTKELEIDEYLLSVDYKLCVTDETFVSIVNDLFNKDNKLSEIRSIEPADFYLEKMTERLRGSKNYPGVASKISTEICDKNKKQYKIITGDGEDFEKLSPGRKSAIILDLILGYRDDTAPIIIDQPEDNLSTDYMN